MSGSEVVGSLLDVIRTLAWPSLLLALAIIFKEPIKRGVERLIEISPTGGAKFAPPTAVQIPPNQSGPLEAGSAKPEVETGIVPSDSAPAALLERFKGNVRAVVSDDQLLPGVEQIRAELKTVLGDSPTDKIEGLMFVAAALNVHLNHERVYQTIFGSQIQALARMNTNFGATRDSLMPIYTAAKASYPEIYTSLSFDQWINYPIQAALCTVGENGNYVLTPFGRGFLKYILDRRLLVEKAG